jgi:hypothetical protein
MARMPEIYYFMCHEGDWCGLYVRGELFAEGHSIAPYEWLRALLELEISYGDLYDESDKLGPNLEKFGGRCPQQLSELLEVMASA